MDKPIAPEVVAIQAEMFARRLKLSETLKAAKVSRSTWKRWKEGVQPNLGTLARIREAMEQVK
jgi:transcriptional regulator with XRE-family HTH domain